MRICEQCVVPYTFPSHTFQFYYRCGFIHLWNQKNTIIKYNAVVCRCARWEKKSAKTENNYMVDGKIFGFKYIVQKSNWIVSNCTIQVINISCWNDGDRGDRERSRVKEREWNIRSDCCFFLIFSFLFICLKTIAH